MYRIFLADDHAIFRAGLKSLLAKDLDFMVVTEARDGQELLNKLKSNRCDLLIMDLSMPHMDGLEALKAIRGQYFKMKILILTMQKDEEHFRHAMANGAMGYLLKEDAYDQLVMAVKTILKGKRFISPSIAAVIAEQTARAADAAGDSSPAILTSRQQQILKFVARGAANKNIAAAPHVLIA